MAGIGFQLQKLFKEKGVLGNVKAYMYSTIVTIGPTVISVLAITSINYVLKAQGVSIKEIEILQATITYSFIFSLILLSGFSFIITRYLADKLYDKKYDDILASLYGALTLVVSIGGVIAFVFYYFSPLSTEYKFLAYMLFILLCIQSVVNCYVSALKNYKKITIAVIYGLISAILLSIVLNLYTSTDGVTITLLCFDLAFFIIDIALIIEIQKYFNKRSKKYFEFLTYFKSHWRIFTINTLWMFGLYVHHLIMWANPEISNVVGGTFVYSPIYDISSFYAYITIMPSMVIFIVKLETVFFEKYSNYFYFINGGACLEDIKQEKREMLNVLYKELLYLFQIQLFFSLGSIIFGIEILPLMGFSVEMVEIFNIVSLGYYCAIMFFIIVTILLYYEDRKGALIGTGIFFLGNLIFTLMTVYLGRNFYGLGMFLGGLVALIYALIRLHHFTKNIDYYIFCKNSAWGNEELEGKK